MVVLSEQHYNTKEIVIHYHHLEILAISHVDLDTALKKKKLVMVL